MALAEDLREEGCPQRLVDLAVARFGRLDAVVNNAAIVARSNLGTTSAANFDRMIAVNVRAPLLLIQAAFPQLKANEGCVLNIGSINAHSGQANLLDYSLSKGAMQTLSRNLANAHCADRVRVNHLNVGWVLTAREYAHQIEHGMPPDWPQHVPEQFAPSGRLIRPEEIAAAAGQAERERRLLRERVSSKPRAPRAPRPPSPASRCRCCPCGPAP